LKKINRPTFVVLLVMALLLSIFFNIYLNYEKNRRIEKIDQEFTYYLSRINTAITNDHEKVKSVVALQYSSKLLAISERTSFYNAQPLVSNYSLMLVNLFSDWITESFSLSEDAIGKLSNVLIKLSENPVSISNINELTSTLSYIK